MLTALPSPKSAPRPTHLRVLEPDARVQGIPEAVIQQVWATSQFDTSDLRTTEGRALSILFGGTLNQDGGPDFLGAHIQIESNEALTGSLSWTGDIEIHRTSGEWLLHRHHEDAHYNRVILHVVLVPDRHTGKLRRADGTLLPELVLYPLLGKSLRHLLHHFYTREQKDFYCQDHWGDVPEATKREWLTRLGTERLKTRADAWADQAEAHGFETVLYKATMRALGYSKNADAMTELARRVPLNLLRTQTHASDVEALLFGISGLLPKLSEMLQTDRHSIDYVVDLRDRFARLSHASDIRPMSQVAWQYFRLRPANFPTRRIAQAAALLAPEEAQGVGGLLVSSSLETLKEALHSDKPRRTLRLLIQEAEVSPFWGEHVRFEHRSAAGSPRIGRSRTDRILVDAVLPILYLDAQQRSDQRQLEAVLSVLSGLPAASDDVTRSFQQYGSIPKGALAMQGLHELHRSWCPEGRCLSCEIGREVFASGLTMHE